MVGQTVLTATFNSYGNRQISTPPPQNRYPWTDQQKIWHSWLRPQKDPLCQIWYKSTHWGLVGKWWNITKIIFIYTIFSEARVQVWPVDGFLRAVARKTWNHARMFLFVVIKLNLMLNPYLSPKTIKIWPKTGLRPKRFWSRVNYP